MPQGRGGEGKYRGRRITSASIQSPRANSEGDINGSNEGYDPDESG